MRRACVRSAAMGVAAILAATAAGADEGDRGALIEGVKEVAAPGVPGSLAVYAPGAGAAIVGKAGAGGSAAVVATARLGKGRVVAFGHDGYFGGEALGAADTGRLVENAIAWAAAGRETPRVGLVRQPGMEGFLGGRGVATVRAGVDDLSGLDVLVVEPAELTSPQAARVRAFVEGGGGLLAAATGWGWRQGSRAPMSAFVGNHLLAGSGLAWTDGFTERTTKGGYAAGGPVSPALNAAHALESFAAGGRADAGELAVGLESVMLALRSIPPSESKFRARAAKSLRDFHGGDLVPTAGRPADGKDPVRRFAIGLLAAVAQAAPPDEVRAVAAAADFPGAVDAKARRVTRTGTIDASIPRWQGLGLYAPPGARITVTAPASAAALRLTVQVGCHTDGLWDLPSWERLPELTRRFPIEGPRTVVASAVGGLIYVDVPDEAARERVELTVAGAVEAPLFRLGETTAADWKKIRDRPAPWAELAGRKVIFTVPSELARRVDDPEPLMKLWDRVVDAQDFLASSPPRRSPERIVCDRQISVGYMHSGYPIMAPIDDGAALALDLPRLRKEGSWGHFHELGHNHQDDMWTFEGTGEVTNNVLAVYAYDKVLDLPYDSGHEAIRDREKRLGRIREHMAKGAPFEVWKDDPFLALSMYLQLFEGFGWDPFERVFHEYARLPRDERPRTDDAKRDQWMVRFSKAVGKDLGPFFRAWGVPTSQEARDSIKDLEAWSPRETPLKP